MCNLRNLCGMSIWYDQNGPQHLQEYFETYSLRSLSCLLAGMVPLYALRTEVIYR